MQKTVVTLFILIASHLSVNAATNFDSLNYHLNRAPIYLQTKKDSLVILKTTLSNTSKEKLNTKFEINRKIVEIYELYKYDSAYYYANELQRLAFDLKSPDKIAYARYKMGLILGAKGLFKEATDTLALVNSDKLKKGDQVDFYRCMLKTYFDLEHYVNDSKYSPLYKNIALSYCDSVIDNVPEDSHLKLVHTGLKKMAQGQHNLAIPLYLETLNNHDLSLHQKAMYNATLGFTYKMTGDKPLAIKYLSKAAIADIKAGVKETTAMRGLAETLFDDGDIPNAYKYILVAYNDALFYGTQHRILEISSILSTIEKANAQNLDERRKKMLKSIVLIAGLTLIALLSLVISTIQIIRLRKARKDIESTNLKLNKVNIELKEANRVKEDYIGYYFNLSAEYIEKLESLKKTINRQLLTNSTQGISHTINEISPKKERKELFVNFDKIFLSIFPEYINKYNYLFREEDRVVEKDNLLSTPQRIFALLKIGISDNEKIAKILNFSVNTIYTYKTKAKNLSIVPNNEFEERIMNIRPF